MAGYAQTLGTGGRLKLGVEADVANRYFLPSLVGNSFKSVSSGWAIMSVESFGQRWVYQIGNHTVFVDNAYDKSGWGQERLIVDGEVVQSSEGSMRFEQAYQESWLTAVGDSELKVRLYSGLMAIGCEVLLEGKPVDHDEYFQSSWVGPKSNWPEEALWAKAEYHKPETSVIRYIANSARRLFS